MKFTALFKKLFLSLVLLFFSSQVILAQGLDQVGSNLEITDFQNVKVGMIVSTTNNNTFELSKIEYDPKIYGVVVGDIALVLNPVTTSSKPVVNRGEAMVLVSAKNGDIKLGDLITSSEDDGIGQKAAHAGHVLGKSLQDYSNDEPGLIPVILNITYNQVSATSESLTDAGIDEVAQKITGAFVTGNLTSIFKYAFALILGAISFLVGLSHFVRTNQGAVEAIARNPLAKGAIMRQLWVGNVAIILVCGVGLAVSLGILFLL